MPEDGLPYVEFTFNPETLAFNGRKSRPSPFRQVLRPRIAQSRANEQRTPLLSFHSASGSIRLNGRMLVSANSWWLLLAMTLVALSACSGNVAYESST